MILSLARNVSFRVHCVRLCFLYLSMLSLTIWGLSPTAHGKEVLVPHEVLAAYYPWWGTPKISGQLRHWGVGITHTPMSGFYDSRDPKVVVDQIRLARQAGITGFVVSWGLGKFEDQAMPLLLRTAAANTFLVSIYYEHAAGSSLDQRRETAYRDLKYIIDQYGRNSAFLKVNGIPVIFLYARLYKEIPLEDWPSIEQRLRQSDPPGAILIGDYSSWLPRLKLASIFDGIADYNPTRAMAHQPAAQLASWATQYYRLGVIGARGKIACATVIPGYDDRSQRNRPPPRPFIDRRNGETYRFLWQAALASRPDWVLITSWNEWHEGTEIEPSQQYDSTALRDTPHFAAELMAMPARYRNVP